MHKFNTNTHMRKKSRIKTVWNVAIRRIFSPAKVSDYIMLYHVMVLCAVFCGVQQRCKGLCVIPSAECIIGNHLAKGTHSYFSISSPLYILLHYLYLSPHANNPVPVPDETQRYRVDASVLLTQQSSIVHTIKIIMMQAHLIRRIRRKTVP